MRTSRPSGPQDCPAGLFCSNRRGFLALYGAICYYLHRYAPVTTDAAPACLFSADRAGKNNPRRNSNMSKSIDTMSVNAIRVLAADAIQKAIGRK